MALPAVKSTKEEQKALALENHKANERRINLVVKIISWKNGLLEGGIIKEDNKITAEEWKRYKKYLLEISKTESVEKVKEKLETIRKNVTIHGGFETPMKD